MTLRVRLHRALRRRLIQWCVPCHPDRVAFYMVWPDNRGYFGLVIPEEVPELFALDLPPPPLPTHQELKHDQPGGRSTVSQSRK